MLKEILFQNYAKIDKNNDAYIEIELEISKENTKNIDVLKQFEPIPYAFTSNYNIIIRYLSLNKIVLALEKINLRQLINLFIADGFYKY